MKKNLILFVFLLPWVVFSQTTIYRSWEREDLHANAKLRVLNLFINVIYDVHTDTNQIGGIYWPQVTDTLKEGVNVTGTIPTYLLDFMDTSYVCGNPHGCITRLYGESSFDTLQIVGDFIVVNVRERRVIDTYHSFQHTSIAKAAVDVINEHGFSTIYGHNDISYYDCEGTGTFPYTQIIIRNISQAYGKYDVGSGSGGTGLGGKYITIGNVNYPFSKGTLQCVGGDTIAANPTGVVIHELSHQLFGGNDFHTSGGNHRGGGGTMPFITVQGGYGLMGGGNSGLVCCNGYERWRMHWKHPASPYYIAAHNFQNSIYVNSDISKSNGGKVFVLRDFVTYGDAIRIQLPYKDTDTTPNQYIWLEFHNVGHNNKLDFLQHSNTSCLYAGTPGIYAYYQIGRDVLESDNQTKVWDGINRDNLRIISNEGFWDYEQYSCASDTDFTCSQWNWENHYYVPTFSNAFCGYQDQERFIVPKPSDNDLGSTYDELIVAPMLSPSLNYKIREKTMHNKVIGQDTVRESIPFLGDSLDAFSSHCKINMGTNPSTCNVRTYYTNNNGTKTQLTFNQNTQYNNQTTYLTGLSIEMSPMSNGTRWLVKIRWDDYDITDDARWTGNIVLKGEEQVNLTRGYSITLAQNRTPAQRYRDSVSGYFAQPTQLTCEAGSLFSQEPNSTLLLTEKSNFILESGAKYNLGDSACIHIQGGSSFHIKHGADFNGGVASTIIVDSLSSLYVKDTARLRNKATIIVKPGGKLVVNGGTITSSSDDELWESIIVEGNRLLPQNGDTQGSVILHNATIENASTAISTHAAGDSIWNGTGGIIQATNTLFRNNRRSVEFTAYENTDGNGDTINNSSYFTNCTFIVNSDNLFAANNTTFNSHITLWGVRGVLFNSCNFLNNTGGTLDEDRRYAIYSMDAGFECKSLCTEYSPQDPCLCINNQLDLFGYCSFSGFYEAIHSANSNAQYFIKVDNCRFTDNQCGVSLNAVDNAQITFSKFALPNLSSSYGIRLNNSTGYMIEGDTLLRQAYSATYPATGIYVDNSGGFENEMRNNLFQNMNYGIYACRQNANAKSVSAIPGLQFFCNQFIGNKYDINVASGKIRGIQGSQTMGADNDYTNTITSSLQSIGNITYWLSLSSTHVPYSPSSTVTLRVSSHENDCPFSICNWIYSKNNDRNQMSAVADESLMRWADEYIDCQNDEICMSELSMKLSELSKSVVYHNISDSIMYFTDLKEWYSTVVKSFPELSLSTAYQLVEICNHTGNYAEATDLLWSFPESIVLEEEDMMEYLNYGALQQLQKKIGTRNWYDISENDISELQNIATADDGRAARKAKEILCFFHGICYGDEDIEGNRQTDDLLPRMKQSSVVDNMDDVKMYPNPANTLLVIEATTTLEEVVFYDLSGRIVLSAQVNAGTRADINISDLNVGIYMVKIATNNGILWKRLIKN